MKGYLTNQGYWGYDPILGKYLLFATEEEYFEYYESEVEGYV